MKLQQSYVTRFFSERQDDTGSRPFSRNISMMGICMIIVVLSAIFLVSYRIAYSVVQKSAIHSAQVQATVMGHEIAQILNGARSQLLTLAAGPVTQEGLVRRLHFRQNASKDTMVRELTFLSVDPAAESFLLINVDGQTVSVRREVALEAYGNPFQVFSSERRQGVVEITDPQDVTYPIVEINGVEQTVSLQVLRLSTPVYSADGLFRGQLILSLDLKALRNALSLFASAKSPLCTQTGALPMLRSAFFDREGWLLFESGNIDAMQAPLSIDGLRSGLRGDSGRAHMHVAFRPSPAYNDYWSMVTAVQQGESSDEGDSPWFAWPSGSFSDAMTTYAPVFFKTGQDGKPTVVGGVMVLDSREDVEKISLELINRYAIVGFVGFLCLVCGMWYLCRILSRPVLSMALHVEQLNGDVPPRLLDAAEYRGEFERLRNGINGLIQRIATLGEADRYRMDVVERERRREIVDLPEVDASLLGDEELPVFVGQSPVIRALRQQLDKVASVQADVLLIGETGTGKEVAAAILHRQSSRCDAPFISINCGALDENLLMDTLFGHVKGAFTEARTDRKGAFVAAEGGTLMLDEVGNASLKVQQALLRALSTRCIRPLGSDTEVPFNVRIVAATNVDLHQSAEEGEFREDLYYRLAVITLQTPPLREHKEDIPEMAAYFLNLACAKLKHPPVSMSQGAMDMLMAFDWPGNVRQFRNVLTRAVAFVEGHVLLAENLVFGAEQDGYGGASGKRQPPVTPDAPDAPADVQDVSGASGTAGTADTPPATQRTTTDGSLPAVFGDSPSDRTGTALNDRQQKAWGHILQRGSISRQEYQDIVGGGISVRSAQYDLQDFVRRGLMRKEGRGPSSRYMLQDQPPQA